MPDCRYCGESFEDETAHREHLEAAHADELGPIDRRRVGADADGGSDLPVGMLAIAGVIGVAGLIVGYVVFFAGGGGSTAAAMTPHDVGSVHYHGTINVTIAGERVDFSRPVYQRPRENPAFHFEGGDGARWHVHARGVTLQYALATLDIRVTGDAVTFEGTTYREGDEGTTVVIRVDGEPVDPATYVLQEGDHVRVVVRTTG